MTSEARSAVVVLIGPPGAGKSSVGALLATQLDVPFSDTDDLVAAAAGKPVGDIFVEDGEAVFREFERAAAARGLEGFGTGGGVLALGSGAVLDADVRRLLCDPGGTTPRRPPGEGGETPLSPPSPGEPGIDRRDGVSSGRPADRAGESPHGRLLVVYLEAGFGAVAKRTGFDKPRVVIPGNPRGRLRAMLEERRPVYESVAALTVPTDDLTPEEVAADLAKQLEAEGS